MLLDSTTKHVLSVSELGDYFGELALIRPVPRTWTMTALTDSVCLTLSRQSFTELLEMDEQLRDAITATAYARMQELSEAILAAVDTRPRKSPCPPPPTKENIRASSAITASRSSTR